MMFFEYRKFNIIIVIAGGFVYVMSPENKKPIVSYELGVEYALKHNDENLIFSDSAKIFDYNIYENSLWCSKRLSVDGIKDLKIQDNVLFGKTYDLCDTEQWQDFSINLDTKEIKGRYFMESNLSTTFRKKSWWKFW